MAEGNFGIKYSKALVEVVHAIGQGRPGELDRWQKMIDAQLAVDEKARTEKNQGWSFAFSAICQTIAIVVGKAFENSSEALKPLGSVISASASPIRDGLSIWSKSQDGQITIQSSKTETARLAERIITDTQSSDDSRIGKLTEHGTRMIEHDK